MIPPPSLSTIEYRDRISKLLSPLRRTIPRVPFYKIAAHRMPTLWYLYRGLLREAKAYKAIYWRIGALFRYYKPLTSPNQTVEQLQKGYRVLEYLREANGGDARKRNVLERYSRLITAKRAKSNFESIMDTELAWQHRLRNRPILTGAFLRASIFNSVVPRMTPQPTHLSMLIQKRRTARLLREKRWQDIRQLTSYLKSERVFEKLLNKNARGLGLPGVDPLFQQPEWDGPLNDWVAQTKRSNELEVSRILSKPSPEMVKIVKEARRRKIAHKTAEHIRERQGEVLKNTLQKRKRGLPAHLISLKGAKGIEEDRILKDPSEGGYTGAMKRLLGMKLKPESLSARLKESAVSPTSLEGVKNIRTEAERRSSP